MLGYSRRPLPVGLSYHTNPAPTTRQGHETALPKQHAPILPRPCNGPGTTPRSLMHKQSSSTAEHKAKQRRGSQIAECITNGIEAVSAALRCEAPANQARRHHTAALTEVNLAGHSASMITTPGHSIRPASYNRMVHGNATDAHQGTPAWSLDNARVAEGGQAQVGGYKPFLTLLGTSDPMWPQPTPAHGPRYT